jgi:hypothetical protein
MLPAPGVEAFAAQLAALPSASAADQAAMEAAQENRYLLHEHPEPPNRRSAGRRLSAAALIETGVAGLLLSDNVIDKPTLAAELASYLAGPPVPVWNYAIIDADMRLSATVPVVGGWELVTRDRAERDSLVGVPSAARYVPKRTIHRDVYGRLAVLRRIDAEGSARSGFVIYWSHPSWDLWQPLLAMSLYQNPVLHLWAQYEIEPGRRVDAVFDRVDTEPWLPDGVTEVETFRPGDYEIDPGSEARFRRFQERLAPLVTAVAQPVKSAKVAREQAKQFRRIAEHFVTAGEDAYGEGEVLSELSAEAVLHYVIALEALLTRDTDGKTELSRKVFQRAAILAGQDDRDRNAVADTVKAAYGARSSYAHGSEAESVDLPALRRVVRDCILARLILGDPIAGAPSLAQLADRALLEHTVLADQVRRPIDEFWAMVDST